MSAHTPGPWTVCGGTGRLNQIAIDPVIGCAYGAGEEVVANARLIAAAPDLLAALIELHAVVKGECPSLLDEDSGGSARLALAVEDAIASATGEKA